jgi:hypothetical protein
VRTSARGRSSKFHFTTKHHCIYVFSIYLIKDNFNCYKLLCLWIEPLMVGKTREASLAFSSDHTPPHHSSITNQSTGPGFWPLE